MKKNILLLAFIFGIAFGFAQNRCPAKMQDSEGNSYQTVLLGAQCWMAENLRTSHDHNGAALAHGQEEKSDDARLYWPNNSDTTNGFLYNWPAAMRACPNGWHLPSDAEWTQLTDYVSGQAEYNCNGVRGHNGKALAATTKWAECEVACSIGNDQGSNNATGFAAFPVGGFYNDHTFGYYGKGTFFWSATEADSGKAYKRYLDFDKTEMVRAEYYQYGGGAVRCLQD